MSSKFPEIDCPYIPATPDPDNHGKIECIVKCNPFEKDVLHSCETCGFNPEVNAERIANGQLVKGKDGLKRLVW